MLRREIIGKAVAGSLLAGVAGWLAACSPSKPAFHGVDITGVDYAQDFSLTDFDGKTRTLADYKGKAVVMFFGYTQCPDVCPTTMGELVQVKQALGADGDKLQVLFISVDPERDTPEVLKAYMANFDAGFVALYADSPARLAKLARDFKVFYQKVEGKEPGRYTVDHTAASYIYDPQGRLRLFSRYGTPVQDVADDVRRLIRGD